MQLEIEEYPEEDTEEPTGPLSAEDAEETDDENDTPPSAEQEAQVQEVDMASGNVTLFDAMQTQPPMPSSPAQTPQLSQ